MLGKLMAAFEWGAYDCLPGGLSGDGIVHLLPTPLTERIVELTAVAFTADRFTVSQ
jgi:hypothetical protein